MRWFFCCLFICCQILTTHTLYATKNSRLLVALETDIGFTPEEFSNASSALLVQVEKRNPFKALNTVFLEHPLIILSQPLETITLKRLASDFGYRLAIFKNESLEEALALTQLFLSKNPQKSSDIPSLPLEKSQQLYDLFRRIDVCFTENNLTYWAGAGTLLGAVRNQGIIKWDDDLDLYILSEDESKLLQMEKSLQLHNLSLFKSNENFYKIYRTNDPLIQNPDSLGQTLGFAYPFADIFIMGLQRRNEQEDLYIHRSRVFYWNWSKDQFTFSQIQNIHRVPFGPFTIPVPGNPEENLNLIYGKPQMPDLWKKYAKEPTWDHSRETFFQMDNNFPGAFVEMDDFSPAPWKN